MTDDPLFDLIPELRLIVTKAGGLWVGIQDSIPPLAPVLVFENQLSGRRITTPLLSRERLDPKLFETVQQLIKNDNFYAGKERKMSESQKLNLRQKLIQVYSRIDHIEKTGHNQKQNYDFVRAADVLHAVRKAFADLGIYAETNYELLGVYDIKTNNGGVMHTSSVKATIKLYDADSDETKTISGLGDGADSGDKGVYKAQTGATKNALRNGTLLPDAEDPEADEQVDERSSSAVAASESEYPELTDLRPLPARSGPTFQLYNPAPALPETATASETTSVAPAAVPDDGSLPTEIELKDYREKFRKLGDDLSAGGQLKSSKGLPINRKLLVFLLSITGAKDAKTITAAQWSDFFERVDHVKGLENGLVGLAKLVNKANGVEEKK